VPTDRLIAYIAAAAAENGLMGRLDSRGGGGGGLLKKAATYELRSRPKNYTFGHGQFCI
jgi:hypothetical protein